MNLSILLTYSLFIYLLKKWYPIFGRQSWFGSSQFLVGNMIHDLDLIHTIEQTILIEELSEILTIVRDFEGQKL